ncbi:MAG: hypothetical protein ACXV76_13805 [Halobacteriota archaeon]
MNIENAADRLIKLGILGKDKQEAIKNRLINQDGRYVKRAQLDYVKKILVRWAYTEGVIQKPERHKNELGQDEIGRGKSSIWPATTVEEAAAVWAVREKWHRIRGGKKSRLSKERIDVIKRAASVINERPSAIYVLPPVIGPLSTQQLRAEDVTIKFVSEECDGLNLFPGKDNTEKADCLNTLVVSWIAALEKVRAWTSAAKETKKRRKMGAEYENPLLAAEFDVSDIDPWSVENVACPWRIDKPARIALCWSVSGTEFHKLPTALIKSDSDELILLENFVDTRTFFKIEARDSVEWAKSVLKNVERRMHESTSPAEKLGLSMLREQLMTIFPYKE